MGQGREGNQRQGEQQWRKKKLTKMKWKSEAYWRREGPLKKQKKLQTHREKLIGRGIMS